MAFEEGMSAAHAGAPITNNPYIAGTTSHTSWHEGWKYGDKCEEEEDGDLENEESEEQAETLSPKQMDQAEINAGLREPE